ncbi:MAG: RHS repeat protein [Bacteroidales bacterium]|nr:RHS repeat protein [Bacteroidales bacterium]MBN2748179.1 RHS repeat protein [Bacteroidales bacterium]
MRKILMLSVIPFLLGISFVSCDKDDKTEPTPVEKKLVPVKETIYEGTVVDHTVNYEYDDLNRLTKMEYSYGVVKRFEYDSQGRVKKVYPYNREHKPGIDSLFYDDNNNLIRVNSYNENNKDVGFVVFEYDEKGVLVKSLDDDTGDGIIDRSAEYKLDGKGHIEYVKLIDYNDEGVPYADRFAELFYTYDEKNSIYKYCGLPKIYASYVNDISCVNNILTEEYKETPYRDDDYSASYSYKYNQSNYPSEFIVENDRTVIEYKEI